MIKIRRTAPSFDITDTGSNPKLFSISVLLFVMIINPASSVMASEIEIKLHDIKELSQQHSQQWQLMELRRDIATKESEAMALPENPSISYDLEMLDNGTYTEYEHSLYVEKEFRMPSHSRHIRDFRDYHVQLEEKKLQRDQAYWLAETRMGFIRIILAREELLWMEQLNSLVSELTEAVEKRVREGETSFMDQQLLAMSSYHLEAKRDQRSVALLQMISEWKSRMGFAEDDDIQFAGTFAERPVGANGVSLPDPGDLSALLSASPAAETREAALISAQTQIDLEQSRRWPSVNLEAGYKQLNPGWHGFLAGISLPVPLLDGNRKAVEHAKIRQQMEQETLTASEQRRLRTASQVMEAIGQLEGKLEGFSQLTLPPDQMMTSLEVAYREGERSLSDVLNALGVMAETYSTYFEQVEAYYRNITRLEALLGRTFIDSN